jgi:hypothetical protein
MKTLCKHTNVPWLGTAVVAAAALFAAVNAGLWEASAFLPALIVVAAMDDRRRRR